MNVRKATGLALGVAVSGVFLWIIFNSIPLEAFLEALKSADILWVLAGLGFFVLGYACRIWRWRLMLATQNADLSWGRCAVPFMASIAANNVLPFRAGDVLRGLAFSQWLNVHTTRVLATLLVERLLDVLSLIVALAVALTLVGTNGTDPGAFLDWGASVLLLIAGAVALILLFPRIFEPSIRWLVRGFLRWTPALSAKAEVEVHHLFHTLSTLAERSRMVVMIFWSFMAWTFEACVFYAIAMAISDITAPVAAWLAMPIGTLSTMLPSTPGYIGTFHYFVMQAAEAVGNPEIAAAAFAFLVHLALYIPATLWGAGSFVYWTLARTTDPPSSLARATNK